MSTDFPNRQTWLDRRDTDRRAVRDRILRYITGPFRTAGGGARDPGRTHAARRLKGPLRVATGPGSIYCESQIKQHLAAGDAAKAVELYERHSEIRGAAPLPRLRPWYEYMKQS